MTIGDPSYNTRIELVYTTNPNTKLVDGDKGWLVRIDDLGSYHVKWDNDEEFPLIEGVDKWDVIDKD